MRGENAMTSNVLLPLTGLFLWPRFARLPDFLCEKCLKCFCESRREVRSTDQDKMLRSNYQTKRFTLVAQGVK